MRGCIETVASVHGASGIEVQTLFCGVVDRWSNLSIAGVIAESHGLPDRTCNAGYLWRIGTSERFAMFEDHGPGSTVCHLDGNGVLAAAEAVQHDMVAGCDLVLLSKFGKLEAAGNGLWQAFKKAIDLGIPVLTSVSPSARQQWETLVAAGCVSLPADAAAINSWIDSVRSQARSAAPVA